MDYELVFDIVEEYYVKPNFKKHVRKCADDLHRLVINTGFCFDAHETILESNIEGMFDLLSYLSEIILRNYGYATRYYIRDKLYYPRHIVALDLHGHNYHTDGYVPNSNPLGGFKV